MREPYFINLNLKYLQGIKTDIVIDEADIKTNLKFKVFDDNMEIDYSKISKALIITFSNRDSSEKLHQGSLDIKENHIEYKLKKEDLIPGIVLACVRLYDENLQAFTTRYFNYLVVNDEITKEDIIEESSYDDFMELYDILLILFEKSNDVYDGLEELFNNFPHLNIIGESESEEQLNEEYPEGANGSFLIGENLYYWNVETKEWINIGAIKGDKGDKGKQGNGVNILGYYETIELLNEAHPTGNIGDNYIVEQELFYWDDINETWESAGNIKGDKGDRGIQGIQGFSTYELAVQNGFLGTIEEWLSIWVTRESFNEFIEINDFNISNLKQETNQSIENISDELYDHTNYSGEESKELHVINKNNDGRYYLSDGKEIRLADKFNYFKIGRSQAGQGVTTIKVGSMNMTNNVFIHEDETHYYLFATSLTMPYKVNKKTLVVTELSVTTAALTTHAHLGCVVGNNICLSGNASTNGTVAVYNMETNMWNNSGNSSQAYGRLFAVASSETELFIFPHVAAIFRKYDIESKIFTDLTPVPDANIQAVYERYKGRYYKVSTQLSYPTYIYDPAENTWETTTEKPPMTINTVFSNKNWSARKDNLLIIADFTGKRFMTYDFETQKYDFLANADFYNTNDIFKFISDDYILITNLAIDKNYTKIYDIKNQNTFTIGNMYNIPEVAGIHGNFMGDYLLSSNVGTGGIVCCKIFEGINFLNVKAGEKVYTNGFFVDSDNVFYEPLLEHEINKDTKLFIFPTIGEELSGWHKK